MSKAALTIPIWNYFNSLKAQGDFFSNIFHIMAPKNISRALICHFHVKKPESKKNREDYWGFGRMSCSFITNTLVKLVFYKHADQKQWKKKAVWPTILWTLIPDMIFHNTNYCSRLWLNKSLLAALAFKKEVSLSWWRKWE